jgi:chemotaxis protein MotB
LTKKKSNLTNYWVSYSDLMAGLLFILFAIIVISNFQYKRKLKVIGENIDLRANIAHELQKRFNKKEITSVMVDLETGDIEFIDSDDLVWFKLNDSVLQPAAIKVLNDVIPIYFDVLLNDSLTKNRLDRILIEGHASQEHDLPKKYLKDLELSEARAFSVVKYMLENYPSQYQDLKSHLVALGRSFADAKFIGITNPDGWRDRKVVIRYTLQYEIMMRDLIQIDKENGN